MSFSQARSSLLHAQWTRNGLEGTVSQVWHCPREDNSGKLAHFPDPANEGRGQWLVKGLFSQPCAWGSLTIIRYFFYFVLFTTPHSTPPSSFCQSPFSICRRYLSARGNIRFSVCNRFNEGNAALPLNLHISSFHSSQRSAKEPCSSERPLAQDRRRPNEQRRAQQGKDGLPNLSPQAQGLTRYIWSCPSSSISLTVALPVCKRRAVVGSYKYRIYHLI